MAKKRRSSLPQGPAFTGFNPKRIGIDPLGGEYDLKLREPKYTMGDLAGMEDIKERVRTSVIEPFVLSKVKADAAQLEAPKGLLLTGEPGTGKTVLVNAIVSEMRRLGKNVSFYHEKGECLTKWFGETEANIRKLFETAHRNGPSVIFFDEIDAIGKQRDGNSNSASTSTLATLLQELNEVERGNVMVIAATNCLELTDKALARTGRFDLTLNIPPPDGPTRRQIFQHYLEKKDYKVEKSAMDRLVADTAKWTGSDIESFVIYLHAAMIKTLFPNFGVNTKTASEIKKIRAKNRCLSQEYLTTTLKEFPLPKKS